MPHRNLQLAAVNGLKEGVNLPPLNKTFPAEQYPVRKVAGTGFTAQAVWGPEADACSATASEMLMELRGNMLSSVSSEGASSLISEIDSFSVPDLSLPEGAAQDGPLILRNEALFPGMVAIFIPGKNGEESDTLCIREDGTFNLSGFFRRQIPKFEIAAVMAAITNMADFLDVYHAMFRPALEAAGARLQFKVMRAVIEAGMKHYTQEDSPQRLELMELRRRVMAFRTLVSQAAKATSSNGELSEISLSRSSSQKETLNDQDWVPTEEAMEMRRRLSDSKRSSSLGSSLPISPGVLKLGASASMDGLRSDAASTLGDDNDSEIDGLGNDRNARSSSGSARSSKIAEQVLTGAAPSQKSPFRLWKSDIGKESYDKSRPS